MKYIFAGFLTGTTLVLAVAVAATPQANRTYERFTVVDVVTPEGQSAIVLALTQLRKDGWTIVTTLPKVTTPAPDGTIWLNVPGQVDIYAMR